MCLKTFFSFHLHPVEMYLFYTHVRLSHKGIINGKTRALNGTYSNKNFNFNWLWMCVAYNKYRYFKQHVYRGGRILKIHPAGVTGDFAPRCVPPYGKLNNMGCRKLSQKRALSDEIATQFIIMGDKIIPATPDSMSI